MSRRILCAPLIILAAFVVPCVAQSERVSGPEYKVPSVKVYLTDEGTGKPLISDGLFAKYCWGWDVLTRTAETDRMMSLECTETKIPLDAPGIATLPAKTILPTGPKAPAGAKFSTPRFKFAVIVVRDETHAGSVSVYDADMNLLDKNGEAHRTVLLKDRPK
jgi:hypothetical protein